MGFEVKRVSHVEPTQGSERRNGSGSYRSRLAVPPLRPLADRVETVCPRSKVASHRLPSRTGFLAFDECQVASVDLVLSVVH
jgi:hypothetical protein